MGDLEAGSEVAAILYLPRATDLPCHLIGGSGLAAFHLLLEPTSVSLTPGPSVCAWLHEEGP